MAGNSRFRCSSDLIEGGNRPPDQLNAGERDLSTGGSRLFHALHPVLLSSRMVEPLPQTPPVRAWTLSPFRPFQNGQRPPSTCSPTNHPELVRPAASSPCGIHIAGALRERSMLVGRPVLQPLCPGGTTPSSPRSGAERARTCFPGRRRRRATTGMRLWNGAGVVAPAPDRGGDSGRIGPARF